MTEDIKQPVVDQLTPEQFKALAAKAQASQAGVQTEAAVPAKQG